MLPYGQQEDLGRLLQEASDRGLRRLAAALPTGGARARAVAEALGRELAERRARDLVFAPLGPAVAPGRAAVAAHLPDHGFALLWRLAQTRCPELRQSAVDRADTGAPELGEVADDICRELAAALEDDADPAGSATRKALQTAGAVRAPSLLPALAPLIRAAIPKLAGWTHHLTGRSAVEVRAAFADAAKLDEAAGPLFLELLSGHLAEPCQALRLISLILDRPSDQFLSSSPLGPFVERLIAGIERDIKAAERFTPDRGGGMKAGEAVLSAAYALLEFEQWVEVARLGPWGGRLTKLRRALAVAVEAQLKAAPRLLAEALPTRSARWNARAAQRSPKLSGDPDPRATARAECITAFLAAIRPSPSTSGFAALRAKTTDAIEEQLDNYVEGLIDLLHRAEPEDRPRLQAYLDVAARLLDLLSGESAGRIVRRRAAAA